MGKTPGGSTTERRSTRLNARQTNPSRPYRANEETFDMTQPTTHRTGLALGLGLCLLGAPDFADAQVACGDTIPKGATVTLTADLECDGVEEAILVDSATLDLGGHTVSCADTNGNGRLPNGIVLLGKKAALRNGTVAGCLDNVVLAGKGKHVAENLTIRDAPGGYDGVYVPEGSSRNRIASNTVTGNSDDGMDVRGHKNVIADNVVTSNGEDGIDLIDVKGNRVENNVAANNADEGIEVAGKANTVSGNTVNDNAEFGIQVVGKRNKTLNNDVSGSGAGPDITGTCKGNVWKDNIVAVTSDCVD
jgi:parallel beta-helix repeat protein